MGVAGAGVQCEPSAGMADFHQSGVITTLHRLGAPELARLEADLLAYSPARPVALVLPCHRKELGTPALKGIVQELHRVRYLRQLVVSLSGEADVGQYEEVAALVAEISCAGGEPPTVVWAQGTRVQALIDRLRDEGLDPGVDGKGRATWLAYGYVLATHVSRVVAVHDCDIVDYDRELLARLCYPTANPNMNYEFAKGYYSRVLCSFFM